jgi:hypothetical protein
MSSIDRSPASGPGAVFVGTGIMPLAVNQSAINRASSEVPTVASPATVSVMTMLLPVACRVSSDRVIPGPAKTSAFANVIKVVVSTTTNPLGLFVMRSVLTFVPLAIGAPKILDLVPCLGSAPQERISYLFEDFPKEVLNCVSARVKSLLAREFFHLFKEAGTISGAMQSKHLDPTPGRPMLRFESLGETFDFIFWNYFFVFTKFIMEKHPNSHFQANHIVEFGIYSLRCCKIFYFRVVFMGISSHFFQLFELDEQVGPLAYEHSDQLLDFLWWNVL